MFKSILFGLGSVGVVGGGGYMIYNATRSEDYKSVGISNGERADENNTQTTTVSDGASQKTSGSSGGDGVGQTKEEEQDEEASRSGSSTGSKK